MIADAFIDGANLHLKDIAVYPIGAKSFDLGLREVVQLKNQLVAEARELGFETLRITGERLTGANPGHVVDIFINLVK